MGFSENSILFVICSSRNCGSVVTQNSMRRVQDSNPGEGSRPKFDFKSNSFWSIFFMHFIYFVNVLGVTEPSSVSNVKANLLNVNKLLLTQFVLVKS